MSIDYSNFAFSKPKNKEKNIKKVQKIKKKSKKLIKNEKNRYSILTNNLEKCFFCSNKKEELHEIFRGRNRQKSIKYGLIIPICSECHKKITLKRDKNLENYAKKIFIKKYSKELFIKEFK